MLGDWEKPSFASASEINGKEKRRIEKIVQKN